MKIKGLLIGALFIAGIGFGSWVLYPTGSPGGKTGSPGDGGANCTQCHAGTPQSASGWITTNIPGSGYTAGQTYTITATGTHTGVGKFGFETTAEDNSNAKKGTFIITDLTQTRLVNANKAVTHTSSGNTPVGNSKTWTFDWTAPAAGTGNITFYGAFNAANGNGTSTGDVIYLTSTMVSEAIIPQTTLTVEFSGMTPHIGQLLEARLINKFDLSETDRARIDPVPSAQFGITFDGVEDGESYFIDIYADLNGNGVYDAPPVDHAWRISADNVIGGSSVSFAHSTNFIDIDWRMMLTMNFSGMTPHVGQLLEIRVIDVTRTYMEAGRIRLDAIPSAAFELGLPYLVPNHTYNVEFYADLNGNGHYDPVPADHAWSERLDNVQGDQVVDFSHNTNFSQFDWAYSLSLEFDGMTPHLGQMISLRVVDTQSGKETGRAVRLADLSSFGMMVPGLMMGHSYHVDFYADLNGNGLYDSPPVDHAWRLEANDVTGNTLLNFTHNTSFEDVAWVYMATLHATGMTPHLGQLFELRIYEETTMDEIGLVSIPGLELAEFYIHLPGTETGKSYNIDFYADLNSSGGYDPPPTDHAWRINMNPVEGDTVVEFSHNTNFTNIDWPVSINENIAEQVGLKVFPNPFRDHADILVNQSGLKLKEVRIYDSAGKIKKAVRVQADPGRSLKIDTQDLGRGVYYISVIFDNNTKASYTAIKM